MITDIEFRALAAQGYNRIPLVLETFADLDTPLSLYLKLAAARYTFLLESVVGGERFGRYSFIGLPAKIRLRVRGRRTEVEDDAGVLESHRATRWRSSSRSASAFARPRCRACRASAAGWPGTSATTPCATSKRASRTRRSHPRRDWPTSPTCCCC